MANIYQELGDWEKAQEQIDWILADSTRQNSLEAQVMAAEVLQAAGMKAVKDGDTEKANSWLREAASGRKAEPIVIWGWSNIANKVARQGLEGNDPKIQKNRDIFFEARLRVAECLLARARLPGNKDRESRLATAETAIAMTRKLYPDLGGDAFTKRYERVLRDVQKELGKKPDGFQALDAQAQPATPAVQETTGATP
jgi:tetratricopeptide (TPR) repeat protein